MFGFASEIKIKATDVFFSIVFAALGFALSLLTGVFSLKQGISELEIARESLNLATEQLEVSQEEFEQAKAEFLHNQEVDIAGLRLKEGTLAKALLDDLVGGNETKQAIAIATVRVALPTLGPTVLEHVKADRNKPTSEIVVQATAALESQRELLAVGLFDSNKTTRQSSVASLIGGWTSDPEVISTMIQTIENFDGPNSWPILDETRNHWLFKTGVINTLFVLNQFEKQALSVHSEALCSMIEKQKGNGPQTSQEAEQLKQKIGCSA